MLAAARAAMDSHAINILPDMSFTGRDTPWSFQPPVAQRDIETEVIYCVGGVITPPLGVSWRSLLLAVLAGIVITLLTRMQHAGDDLGPKLVADIAMSFVLVAAQLFHSVLDSILMFTGLLGGQAAFTWGDWARARGWSGLGNSLALDIQTSRSFGLIRQFGSGPAFKIP